MHPETASPTTGLAVAFTQPGGPDVLHVTRVPVAEPGPGEVRVRVEAAAVHPSDIAIRAGMMPIAGPPPHVPGMAYAGVVEATGTGSAWRTGDRVMGMALPSSPYGGAYRERIVAPDDTLAAVPDHIRLDQAATLPMNGHTAIQAMRVLDLAAGSTIVVTGAAGALAAILLPLAAAAGLRVIGVCADDDHDTVLQRGATSVVTRGDDLAARVLSHAGGPVDAAVDLAVVDEAIVPAVRPGGVVVTLRGWAGAEDSGARIVPVMVPREWRAGRQLEMLADAPYITRPVETFAPHRAAQAHARIQSGRLRSGVVIDFR
ncbi:alcohol dehydrogenase catalytic domain-containing protein [Microbacterium lushaniae]|uniref:Alcohol dehydrogenase catalytic domain-containing protein n=1 Tax=Microbacterium lushaniae TaxID=2614639 RepID=A0A5J6L8A2_9MICO|nr:alcohol dehydrogenase catalytic domain-containing protein [Microbacterium lushaniae]QEW04542.1 alcohol dehydrogenase catalytic domain-containing protein [Microbacterium lushaniae]